MNTFWEKLRKNDEKTQHFNINIGSLEGLTDALNDNPEEVADSNQLDENPDPNANDETDNISDTDLGGGDIGDDNLDMDETDSMEPVQIKKDKFSLLNGKIDLIERFQKMIEKASSVRELLEYNFNENKEIIDDLAKLVEMMDEIKSKIAIKTQSENLVQYNLCYMRLKSILKKCELNLSNNND